MASLRTAWQPEATLDAAAFQLALEKARAVGVAHPSYMLEDGETGRCDFTPTRLMGQAVSDAALSLVFHLANAVRCSSKVTSG